MFEQKLPFIVRLLGINRNQLFISRCGKYYKKQYIKTFLGKAYWYKTEEGNNGFWDEFEKNGKHLIVKRGEVDE
jgi:hypothetical protein